MPRVPCKALLMLLPLWLMVASPCLAKTPPSPPQPVRLTAAGSGVNLGITRLLAEAFNARNPRIVIEVPGSIGTKGAITATADGVIDIGLISRPLKEDEQSLGLTVQPYACTALVIGAHAGVKDDTITTQELIDIFSGTKTSWQDGSQIIVQARERSDSGFQIVENSLPGFREAYHASHEAKRWTLYFNDQDANHALATVPCALGITDLGMIATEHLAVKALKLNGIAPDPDLLQSGAYPLGRTLSFLYRSSTLKPEAKMFLDFVASPEGRSILQANSYLPMP